MQALALVRKEKPAAKLNNELGPLVMLREMQAAHPAPEEWVARLRAISPVSVITSWLMLSWLDKAERWVLYEMIPEMAIPPDKKLQLDGTPYWLMPEKLRMGRMMMCSAFQWEMYRVYKCWARPFGCLQGPLGFTPGDYSEMERAVLRAHQADQTPPRPGSMAYAPFDERAETEVRRRDRLWRLGGNIDVLRRSGATEIQKAETAAAEHAFRTHFWAWWNETMTPQADFLASQAGSAAAEDAGITRPATALEERIGHELEETYITTGVIPVPLPSS